MNKKEQMKQILKETIDYYAKDPDSRRSVDDGGNCRYTLGDKHCAIGRYLKEEYQREDWIENDFSVNELCDEILDLEVQLSKTKVNIPWYHKLWSKIPRISIIIKKGM